MAARMPSAIGTRNAARISQTTDLSFRRVIWKTCHICLRRPGSLGRDESFAGAEVRAMVPTIRVRGRPAARRSPPAAGTRVDRTDPGGGARGGRFQTQGEGMVSVAGSPRPASIGGYRLVRTLGAGPRATVHLGHADGHPQAAVKVFAAAV